MESYKLKNFLRQHSRPSERNPGCPDDHVLVSYMEGGLSEPEYNSFEHHLSDCDFCLERVGMLGRARDNEPVSRVSGLLLARSRKLARDGSDKSDGLRSAPRWAAAAVVVLTFGLLISLEFPNQDSPELTPPSTQPPVMRQQRNIDPYALSPQIISPTDGSSINPTTQQFTWAPIRDSLFYRVRIVSDVGDLVWQERVNGTQWRLPVELSLLSSAEYYVRIDAYLTETKTLNSDYVVFRVEAGN